MFFDNASTTRIDDEIIDRLSDFNNEYFYNPGALYADGLKTKYKSYKLQKRTFIVRFLRFITVFCKYLQKRKSVFGGQRNKLRDSFLQGRLAKGVTCLQAIRRLSEGRKQALSSRTARQARRQGFEKTVSRNQSSL